MTWTDWNKMAEGAYAAFLLMGIWCFLGCKSQEDRRIIKHKTLIVVAITGAVIAYLRTKT